MLAYMIYEKEEGEKNKGFIEIFEREGMQYGISFLFIFKEEYKEKTLPDLVLNRTRDPSVSLWYEERGIPVLHSSALVRIGNDKWKTLCYLKDHFLQKNTDSELGKKRYGGRKIWPETLYFHHFDEKMFYQKVIEKCWHRGEDLVLKTVDGHGGNEVFLLPSDLMERKYYKEENTENVIDALRKVLGRRCILQEQIKSHAMDVRVYIVGNQIYHGVLRTGTKDFRSNFSLGGSVREYLFSVQERQFIEKILEAFSALTLGLTGLDFIIEEDGSMVFNELEEMVGCRMLYECTKKDIVKDYVKWIAERKICIKELQNEEKKSMIYINGKG